MNEQFLQFLKDTPAAMGRFLRIVEDFLQSQAKPVALTGTPGPGPQSWSVGGEVKLTTIPISDADINDLFKGTAEAHVREKAFEFIKGFFFSLQIAGGAA